VLVYFVPMSLLSVDEKVAILFSTSCI
jgi:hypothetical protein